MPNYKNAKEIYDATVIEHGGKAVDINYSFRRNSRQPLDESSLPKNLSVLNALLNDYNSNIYKGQIVVTQGDESPDLTYFTPYLIKYDKDISYIADRIMTVSYTNVFLESEYVKKRQLGTSYTGVGKWIDGVWDRKDYTTLTYSEIFNDYINNDVTTDSSLGSYAIYAHVEGSMNETGSSYSHVEGYKNTIHGNAIASHIEGSDNVVGTIDQDSLINALNSVHVEGNSNRVYGKTYFAHIEGLENIASFSQAGHVGGHKSVIFGEYAFTHGFNSMSYKNGVAFGISNVAYERSTTFGSYNISSGFDSFTNGDHNIANGESSHAEGAHTKSDGDYAHSEGNATVASGESSHAEGTGTMATTLNSHTEGLNTVAYGIASHTEGVRTQTGINAKYAHSEGDSTNANGESSHSEGKNTTANKNYSHSEGNETIANGVASHSEGSNTKANGESSHSEGSKTEAGGNYSHSEGYHTIIDAGSHYSHSEGNENKLVHSQYSHAEGSDNTVTNANYAHAEGNRNNILSNANYSHVEGYDNKVAGVSAHAEGNTTYAVGDTSHAEGNKTISRGDNSHAEGNTTYAEGVGSHAEGLATKASGEYSHTSGKYSYTGILAEAANAEGINTYANGQGTHSEGYKTIAGFTKKDNTVTIASHAEGALTYAAGDYSHSEGYLTQSYGVASKVSGFGSRVVGDYAMSHGFYNKAPNMHEIAFGSYNRSYTNVVGLEGDDKAAVENITSVVNNFAKLNNYYVPGRYPQGIVDSNAKDTNAYYDLSYTTIFSIGDGNTDNLTSEDPNLKPGAGYSYKDAGDKVKKEGRHNILDIRKNGQMYYGGGMIVGGEIVAPMSYSYVNSLGPTAYMAYVTRASLEQPKYFKPSLQYCIWYTGSNVHDKASVQDMTTGWSYFGSSTVSDCVCEVGMPTKLTLQFRAFNVGADKPQRVDPIYHNILGNMLGYSTGIHDIAYQIMNGSGNLVSATNPSTLVGMSSNSNTYLCKRLDAFNIDKYAYYSSYCNAVDNIDTCGETHNHYTKTNNGDLYSKKTTLTTSVALTGEGSHQVFIATSYEFNAATQMYFQELMEKNTYIPDDGAVPYEKFKNGTFTSKASFTIHTRYRVYYGCTNNVPNNWNSWTQTQLLQNGDIVHGHLLMDENPGSGHIQKHTFDFKNTAKTCWIAFPDDIYTLVRYDDASVPANKLMFYINGMGAKSALETGKSTDAVYTARQMYEYTTSSGINPSGKKYKIVAVYAPEGITQGTVGFALSRK